MKEAYVGGFLGPSRPINLNFQNKNNNVISKEKWLVASEPGPHFDFSRISEISKKYK